MMNSVGKGDSWAPARRARRYAAIPSTLPASRSTSWRRFISPVRASRIRLTKAALSDRFVMTAETCGAGSSPANVAPPLKSMRTRLRSSGEWQAIMPNATVRKNSDLPEPVAPMQSPCGPIPFSAASLMSSPTGAPVELDIKEAAENGMGPHGLCIGATGSGKSEFLRTVALGMMACHSPEDLNLVLIDFKGGATFAGLEPASHVAAVITNLSDKRALVRRMRDALTGEMNRRQEALR